MRSYFNRLPVKMGLSLSLVMAASSGTAQATSFTAQSLLSTFNLIASGNVTTQQDIEGSTVIGGNLNGATFFNNNVPPNPSIYLYGNLGGGNVNINGGGTLYYTGTPTGVNFNGGSKQNKGALPNALTDYTTPLTQLSTKLGSLASTVGATVSNGNFNAHGASGLIVFNLNAADLNNDLGSNITFTGGAGVTGFIVNVTGNYSEAGGFNFNTAQRNALFNFTDATNVSLGNWKASVLAPKATLGIQNGYIAGSVFAASFTGGGELHTDNLYNGALPSSSPVPEASTWAMMLAGFGLVGLAMRARREMTPALALARI